MAIKNIIFDLGGVILNIDYQAPARAFEALGFAGFEQIYSQQQQTDLFDRLETGKADQTDFRAWIRKNAPVPLTDAQIDQAWWSILKDFPAHRLEALKALKSEYRTFLLSNTNAHHVVRFHQILQESFGIPDLSEFFEVVHYSNELGMRKPHPETFTHVCNLHGLKADETLFIDDSLQHIVGAKAAGLNTIHLQKGEEFSDELADLGIHA